jgi:uncharacterized membrane protein YgcG
MQQAQQLPQWPPSSNWSSAQAPVSQRFQQFGQQVQQGAEQFGRQVQQGAEKAAQQSQSWLCKNILPPKHDAGKALAIAAAALIFFVIGAALGAWRSWFAIVLGIAVAVAIFIGVYIGAAKYDYNNQKQCAMGTEEKAWWPVTCSGNNGSTNVSL